jgi:hypothetical protein
MVARERKGTLQIFGDSNDSESRTGFFAGTRADRRGHGRVWSRHMCAGAEWLAARRLNRRRPLLQSAKLSLFAGVTNELLIFGDLSSVSLPQPAVSPLEPVSLISGILTGARVAPSRFSIRLNFTCTGHEPRTMRLLGWRHRRLIDTRRRDNCNFARFGASFTPSF